ncbi:TetR/AcrR family transcriptional regulator [Roseimicrobium sp. ORNL1]|uniref:TetR/AcrR family transcriptional regulator n=1 Tax=Roseimicrobium sp. ORNL1 TaxID=2711231 RepID=UPI0013E14CC2|nr:TetR/AcrR family transcriptional regulator [Roseimicrobium sp. ORNL1]QIF02370.1 TetR/AcrR family transcriptional regulator [Roseimicrobium sp. ORNL1]
MARRRDITKAEIIDAARHLIEMRGCNGFSVRDVSEEVGLTTASLHYHFPTKGGLITGVISQDRAKMNERMAAIEGEAETFASRTELMNHFFSTTSRDPGAIGPAVVAVVDLFTLPLECQAEVQQWFLNLEGWLTRFAMQARATGEFPTDRPVDVQVSEACASLLGTMLLSRTREHLSPLQGSGPRLANRIHGHNRPPGTGLP